MLRKNFSNVNCNIRMFIYRKNSLSIILEKIQKKEDTHIYIYVYIKKKKFLILPICVQNDVNVCIRSNSS